MQTAQSAIGFLRVVGWLVLVGALVLSGAYILNIFSVSADARGIYALVDIGILLGGIFVWAVCIALATTTENSIATLDILLHQENPGPPYMQPRRRSVDRYDYSMLQRDDLSRPPATPNPGIRLWNQADDQAPEHHVSRVTRVPVKK